MDKAVYIIDREQVKQALKKFTPEQRAEIAEVVERIEHALRSGENGQA